MCRQLIAAQERDVFDEQARQALAFARRRGRVSPQLRKIGRKVQDGRVGVGIQGTLSSGLLPLVDVLCLGKVA